MNLENFDVQEMNFRELVNIDAGWDWSDVGIVVGYVDCNSCI